MTLQGFLKYPGVFLLAFAVTYALVPAVMRLAERLGVLDRPDARHAHKTVVPRAGGVAVFLGFHCGCAAVFLLPWSSSFTGTLDLHWWLSFAGASTLLLFVGLFDDAFNLRWSTKLVGQATAAAFLFMNGVSVNNLFGIMLSPGLNFAVTLLWFLAFINAFNLIDGLDGLATGLAVIAALGLAGASFFDNRPSDALTFLCLAGASSAFLRFNFAPASIFLGDSGSMFLGLTLAAAPLASSSKTSTLSALVVPLLAVGVPVFDTMLAVWRRSVRSWLAARQIQRGGGFSSWLNALATPDRDHLHHRLLSYGLSQKKAAFWLYGLNVSFVCVALLSVVYNSRAGGVFLLAFVAGCYVVIKHLARVELWDSGTAILKGLSTPRRSIIISALYPAADCAAMAAAYVMTLFLTGYYDTSRSFPAAFDNLPLWCCTPFICLAASGTYRRVWSRARLAEFLFLALAVFTGSILALGFDLLLHPQGFDRALASRLVLFSLSACAAVLTIRLFPRAVQDLMCMYGGRDSSNPWNILVYGAGNRGLLFLTSRVLMNPAKRAGVRVIGFLDDDLNLRKRTIYGYPVLGPMMEMVDVAQKLRIDEIVIAADLPPASLEKMRRFCGKSQIRLSEWLTRADLHESGAERQPPARIRGIRL